MLVRNLTGRLIVSFLITIAFGTFYLMGSYYIEVHLIYSQKKEGSLGYKQRTFLVVAYFARYVFSFAVPSAWFICLSYSIFSPKKVTIFEMFTTLKKSDFNSPVVPFIGNKNFFWLFQIAQFFVLPLRGAIIVLGIVCAYFKRVRICKDPGLFLYLFLTTFFYCGARQRIDCYLAEKVKQKLINQGDLPKPQKAVSEVSTPKSKVSPPNLTNALLFSLTITVGIHHVLAGARLCNDLISKQKEKQEGVKVNKETKTDNN